MKRVLIMGLPGSGKTTLSKILISALQSNYVVEWFNADVVREKYNDWDFSTEGRIRQAVRMKELSESSTADIVICDFVAPLETMRDIFDADIVIWLDTIISSRYDDTNNIFEPPKSCTFRVRSWDETILVIEKIKWSIGREA